MILIGETANCLLFHSVHGVKRNTECMQKVRYLTLTDDGRFLSRC